MEPDTLRPDTLRPHTSHPPSVLDEPLLESPLSPNLSSAGLSSEHTGDSEEKDEEDVVADATTPEGSSEKGSERVLGSELWRVVGLSVTGSSHQKLNLPCQDACHWGELPNQSLVLSIADGAGSAPLSEVGSRVASRVAVEQAAVEVQRLELSGALGDEIAWQGALRAILEAARAAVEAEAAARRVNARDLATTLIVVIATPELVAGAQVGDGAAIVGDDGGAVWPLTLPQRGEYLNETTFLISERALATAQITVRRECASHLAALSDGLQMLALQMSEATPHAPFFAPLFTFVGQAHDDNAAREELAAFLRSPRVQQRTDDDLTLVLASRQS